jgi:Protein of unknown function (DUF2806)
MQHLVHPLRLIDVLSSGPGNVYHLIFAKAIGRGEGAATREKIKEISQGIDEAQQRSGVFVHYQDDSLEIIPSSDTETPPSRSFTLKDRAIARLEFLAEKQQRNIEMIAGHAASLLQEKDSVPPEKPDEDWIARFFSVAQDISSAQMQELWGRILAGEIQKPGTYSLATLDFVRNLRTSDAALIERLSKVVATTPEFAFVPFWEDAWYKDVKNLIQNDFFTLGELGVIFPTNLGLTLFQNQEPVTLIGLRGNKVAYIQPDSVIAPFQIGIWKLTKVGTELMNICDSTLDNEFREFFCARIRRARYKVSIREVVVKDNTISFRAIDTES